MVNALTKQQVDQFLNQQGIATGMSEADTMAAINANPQARATYMNMVNAPQQAYTPPATATTGAMPVGIEPLHQFERSSLAALGNYQTPAAFGQAAGALNQALGTAQQYAQPLTAEQFQQGVQMYSDPYQQQVTDVALQDIDDQAASLRNRIMNRNPGARSFGSSATGVQLSELGGNVMDARARAIAEGGSRAFGGATDFMLRNRAQGLQGLSGLGNIATQLGGLGAQQQQADFRTLGARGGAGRDIRQFNQNLSDIAMQNYMGAQQYPYTNLTQLGQLAGVIPGTQQQFGSVPGSGQQFGAGLTALGQLLSPAQQQRGLV